MSMNEIIKPQKTDKYLETSNLLVDRYGRLFDYARIALNEKCNLRCVYCMPEEGIKFKPDKDLLSNGEIKRIISLLSDLGVKKIRFTGGEPLLREDIFDLIEYTSVKKKIRSTQLTTNGVLLESVVDRLASSGLNGVNISLDTLKPEKFKIITRRFGLEKVVNGLDAAIKTKALNVKLNVVLMRNFNDDELFSFAELTKSKPIVVRFIELMPFDSKQIWKTGKFYGSEEIIGELKNHFPNMSTATGTKTEHSIFNVPGYVGKIAVIPAYSRNLCGACNRIRITADGKILNCLFSNIEHDLKGMLRSNQDNDLIKSKIKNVMLDKMQNGWLAEKSGEDRRNSMTQIGG